MSNNLTLSKPKTSENSYLEMDALIKFILATVLACLPFLFAKPMSLSIVALYLVIVTLFSKIKPRTLILSATSYCIIVLIPYLFGLLMNALFYAFSNNDVFVYHQAPYDIFLRLFRLFIIWYVSILYFHTTPMKTVIGLLDKLLTPLKLLGVPVADYLKVVMCIVLELTETGSEMQKKLGESMRSTMGEGVRKFRINIKGISQIIVSLIVNSFEKLDRIQAFVEKVNPDELYGYQFKFVKNDIWAVLSFIFFIVSVWIVEKGYWF
jgi:energy-coupling factor transporter transmembrane protein EcfT